MTISQVLSQQLLVSILHCLKTIGKLWEEWNRQQPMEGKMATGRLIFFTDTLNSFLHFCKLTLVWTLKGFKLAFPD